MEYYLTRLLPKLNTNLLSIAQRKGNKENKWKKPFMAHKETI